MRLTFAPAVLADYDRVYAYMSRYGEGSCQHSFVTMYTLYEKYGDEICECDGFLYTHRSHLSDAQYRVYLAPMGGGDLLQAYKTILDDARSYGKKAKFYTLTPNHAALLRKELGDRFIFEDCRDMAEYIYLARSLAEYLGGRFATHRKKVNHIHNQYQKRLQVKQIDASDFADILRFEARWLDENRESHDAEALEREARSIATQLAEFDALHLSGIVIRLDGEVVAFGYGTPLNDDFYDSLIEKADRSINSLSRVIRQEVAKQCALSYCYNNGEEDVGIKGLRELKLMYHPEFLIEKTIATEIWHMNGEEK